MKLCFIDTETTGLDPDIHEVWEIGAIIREEGKEDWEYHKFLPLFNFKNADPFALDIGKFWDRYIWPDPKQYTEYYMQELCRELMQLTKGAYIVGAVPSFDIERLDRLCHRFGYRLFNHYHLIDCEALAAGHLHIPPPWKSDEIFAKLGIDTESEEYTVGKHTALGDARVVRQVYDRIISNE